MDPLALGLLTLSGFASFAALGGVVARRKKRRPTEGVLLGLFLGPVGVALETRLPAVERPEVCEHARNSFLSMTAYQARRRRRPGRRPIGPGLPDQSSASSGSAGSTGSGT